MATKEWIENHQEDIKRYRREYYHRNSETEKARIYGRKIKIAIWFQEYKKTLRCIECGEGYPCIDFHHKSGTKKDKKDLISKVSLKGWSKERILNEIESNCLILCANCHRKLHYNERINKQQ